jgi:hypothetical protein
LERPRRRPPVPSSGLGEDFEVAWRGSASRWLVGRGAGRASDDHSVVGSGPPVSSRGFSMCHPVRGNTSWSSPPMNSRRPCSSRGQPSSSTSSRRSISSINVVMDALVTSLARHNFSAASPRRAGTGRYASELPGRHWPRGGLARCGLPSGAPVVTARDPSTRQRIGVAKTSACRKESYTGVIQRYSPRGRLLPDWVAHGPFRLPPRAEGRCSSGPPACLTLRQFSPGD